jgi:hypothetical protein
MIQLPAAKPCRDDVPAWARLLVQWFRFKPIPSRARFDEGIAVAIGRALMHKIARKFWRCRSASDRVATYKHMDRDMA